MHGSRLLFFAWRVAGDLEQADQQAEPLFAEALDLYKSLKAKG